MVPVDIYNVNNSDRGDFDSYQQAVLLLYYGAYAFLLFVGFILIPFAYFYFEEESDEEGRGNERMCVAIKYTMAFFAIAIIVIVTALILAFGISPDENASGWINHLLTTDRGERALRLIVGILALIGLLGWVIYTAYGMAFLPISMIRGQRRAVHAHREIAEEQQKTDEKIRQIQSKGELKGNKLSKAEQKKLEDAEHRKRFLEARSLALEQNEASCCTQFCSAIQPFTQAFGGVLFLAILLIMASMFSAALHCLLHSSSCSSSRGYIAESENYLNPLDRVLTLASQLFPLDYIILFAIIIIVFCCSAAGVAKIGVYFFYIKVSKFRKGRTKPQGLLLMCFLLMLITVTFSAAITMIVPQYVTFGTQKTIGTDGKQRSCQMDDISGSSTDCKQSEISQMWSVVILSVPFFGIAYYWASWAFIAVYLFSVVVCLCGKTTSFDSYSSDSEDEENLALLQTSTSAKKPRTAA